MAKGFVKHPERPGLKFLVEIDQDIAARDELHFSEDLICGQTVIREDHIAPQRLVQYCAAVRRHVVVRERALTSGVGVVPAETRDAVDTIDTSFRFAKGFYV